MGEDRPRPCLSLFGAESLLGGRPHDLLTVALAAEAAGVDQINVTDHVVMGPRPDRYPYGRFPVPPTHPWPEPLTVLAAIAGVTRTVRLSTGVLIAPLRPAPLLAKQVATLDALSGGRVDLGVGVGWQREEYDAAGLDFEARWRLLDASLRTARALWTGRPTDVQVGDARIERIVCSPPPDQRRLPVWFGVAGTPRQAARIAEHGDGWIPIDRDVGRIARGVALLRRAFEEAGRSPDELAVRAKLPRVPRGEGASLRDRAALALSGAPDALAAGVTVVDVALAEHVSRWEEAEPFLAELVAARDRLAQRGPG